MVSLKSIGAGVAGAVVGIVVGPIVLALAGALMFALQAAWLWYGPGASGGGGGIGGASYDVSLPMMFLPELVLVFAVTGFTMGVWWHERRRLS